MPAGGGPSRAAPGSAPSPSSTPVGGTWEDSVSVLVPGSTPHRTAFAPDMRTLQPQTREGAARLGVAAALPHLLAVWFTPRRLLTLKSLWPLGFRGVRLRHRCTLVGTLHLERVFVFTGTRSPSWAPLSRPHMPAASFPRSSRHLSLGSRSFRAVPPQSAFGVDYRETPVKGF